jgi:hypothetical protein
MAQSNWKRQSTADEDFTRAAWDAFMATLKERGVNVSIQLFPSLQRGVWVFVLEATSTRHGETGRTVARYQGSYPNGTAATLSAYLFRAANALAQMVDSARLEDLRLIWPDIESLP